MDPDEISLKKAGGPLASLIAQDLDPLSVMELDERIAMLEGEVARTRARRERAVDHRATADGIFKS